VYGTILLLMTKTVVKGASKREKMKSEGPGFLDPVWYGMLWDIWYRAIVWYGTIP
jgi:hypothetical protein